MLVVAFSHDPASRLASDSTSCAASFAKSWHESDMPDESDATECKETAASNGGDESVSVCAGEVAIERFTNEPHDSFLITSFFRWCNR